MLLDSIRSFDFIFSLHLMRTILGITHELSQVLQRKEQGIINAMNLVSISKQRLQYMRDSGWDSLLEEVHLFCDKHEIVVPSMDEVFSRISPRCRSSRKAHTVSNIHRYRVELYYTVIYMQLQELNNRFNEVNTELLLCVACLNPVNSFDAFNKERLMRLAQFYPKEFSAAQRMVLENQIETFIIDMRSDKMFQELHGLGQLAKKMVETKRNLVYPLVYLLVTLTLILPVATATVERAFSAMNIIKNRLRNRMGDQWMNDNLVTYIEKDILKIIDKEVILQRFQNMKLVLI